MDKKADWCLVFFKAPYQGKNSSIFSSGHVFSPWQPEEDFPSLACLRCVWSLPKQLKIYMEESMGYMSAFYILKNAIFRNMDHNQTDFVLPRRKMVSVRLL